MNRTDRLFAITLELRARQYTRAEDLAAQFEVSVRTIYRDVEALCEAGVPVVSTPGYGYSLAEGYFLPPLILTADEAGALLLGATFVAEQLDAPYAEAVASARKKVTKILPEATRQEVDSLLDSLRFVGRVRGHAPAVAERLAVLRRAVQGHEIVHIAYHARQGEPTQRDVEPHGLVQVAGVWMLMAYCRSRQDMRAFRLDRMDDLRPTGERFQRRPVSMRRPPPLELGPVEVRVLFAPDVVRWAREDRPAVFVAEEPHADGVVMVFRPRAEHELVSWLLGWGAAAEVLSPLAMRQTVAAAARALAERYNAVPAHEPR